jgi:hypothetical protein
LDVFCLLISRFDKGDVQAITKSHLQEKRELNEAISVLKKVLIRSGAATEAELDLELSCILDRWGSIV